MEADLDDDWELTSASNAINLVIVGKTGNGKSATGNSILGREVFFSDLSPSGVTSSSELQSTTLKDGSIVNVIDTPGLFDFSTGSEFIGREIVKCITLAKDGIHAVLMVFSIGSRFTREEEAAIESMKSLFGNKIVNYMIVVFTGGDTLEAKGKTLKDYISLCPDPLRNIIKLCNNRVILFDNTTKNIIKRENQINQLLCLVESAVVNNGGKPYSDQIFTELKEEALLRHEKVKEVAAKEGCSKEELSELKQEMSKSYNDQLKRVTAIVEEKLKFSVERLEKQLFEEQAARLDAQRVAEESQLKSDKEIRELREELKKARKESEELQKHAETSKCNIL